MNTNPDDTKLALWLDDELEGEELAAVEASCAANPGLLARREEQRAWKLWISQSVPSAEEPPYAEFFNARILRGIERAGEEKAATARSRGGSSWRAWFMPAAAAAGMVIAFQLGARTQPVAQVVDIDVSNAPRAIPVEPILYTPEKGVKARWFNSAEAEAFVIVLEGVPAIPDTVDFSKSLSRLDEDEAARAMVDLTWPKNPGTGGGS
jgi:hypothetical protein